MTSWLRRALILAALPLAACNLYFGNGGDDDQPPPCQYGGDWAGSGIRDPQTGECQYIDYGCDYYGTGSGQTGTGITTVGSSTTGSGSGAADGGTAVGGAMADWATCPGACEELGEADCLATSGCRAIYTGFACPPNADCAMTDQPVFSQCWEVAPSGPIEGGDCWGLDAQACSEHDDCAATFNFGDTGGNGGCGIPTGFQQCFPEPGRTDACAATDCAPGYHCEQQCYPCDPTNGGVCNDTCDPVCVPDDTTCNNVDCGPGQHCEEQCSGVMCNPDGTCPPDVCEPVCVDSPDPGCDGPVTCLVDPPDCPQGTTPGVSNQCYTGYCVPVGQCGTDPGTCDDALCDAMPPACPTGTTPGVLNGCYTGYCIPLSACPAQAPCPSLTDEASCIGRNDCVPIYVGTDCTCDPNGCTCATQTFARCDDAAMTP